MYGLTPGNSTESRSIQIDSPAEVVWDLLTTIANIDGWYDDWDTVEHDESDRCLGPGVGFRLIRDRRGHIETARCVVAVFDPPHRLGWIEDGPHGRTVLVDFHLHAGLTGGTVLTLGKSF
ncbi:SRPBCC family protein [Mycolicibacterium septicum]|nr:SRPBCC family protein [Mycolicibacterium septicum]